MVTAGTSTSAWATWYPFQRKSFYANGRFWVFYSDGTNMVYRTSTDGVAWSAATTVRAATYGWLFSVWFDGTYLHYAYANGTSIYYRRGTPNSDGTITWSAAEQTVSTTYNKAYYPMVSVDSNGYVWIGYMEYTGTYYYPYVIKSGNNDGTWGTTPSDFPYQLSTTSSSDWKVSPIPLTAGKMLAVYTHGTATVNAKRWDGSAWGTEVTTASLIRYGEQYSAVAQGDDVHLTFLKSTGYDILYVKYTYNSNSFGTETTLQATATGTSSPVISIDSSNNLYVFWAGYPTANHIYYRKYTASTNTWETAIDRIDESTEVLTDNSRLTCFYKQYGDFIGLVYMTKTSSPYNVKFDFLTFVLTKVQTVSVLSTLQSKLSGILSISRVPTTTTLVAGKAASRQFRRIYLEWPITAIPKGATITAVKLKYHGKAKPSTDTVSVYSMENQPSAQPDTDAGNEIVYKDVEDGTAYISGSAVFPAVGANQELDLGTDAVADLQAAVNAGRTWFAIGVKTSEQTIGDFAEIYSEEYEYADPKPTLVVTYTTLSAPPYRGIYLCRMAKTKDNFLRQTLVAKVPTDLVEKITFAGKADTTPAQIEVLVHYDDYYSDTSTISLTTDWAVYAVKFSPGKNIDYITATYVGDTEAGKYLYFDEFTIDFHEIEVSGAVESYIQPFQEIDTTITRDASGNITKVEMANATRKVTLEITRDAQGRIITIEKTVT